jgi:hypothetical protein
MGGPVTSGVGHDRPTGRGFILWSGAAVAVPPCRPRWNSVWVWAILAATFASLFLATGGRFLRPEIPLLGDIGGHVHALTELRSLLGEGRIRGWSNDWFSGFPLFFFYFPLPALLAVGLSELIGLAPAVAALVVLGPILLPIATGVLVRALGGSRGMAGAAGVAAAVFLLSRALALAGGTFESAMLGEYSYSFAMALAVFYLASLPRALAGRSPTALILPTLLLAATALSHVLVTGMAVVLSAALLDDRRKVPGLVATWALAFLVSGWWTVPFLLLGEEMHRFTWPPLWELPAGRGYLVEGVPVLALALLGLSSRTLRAHRRLLRLCVVAILVGALPPLLGELRVHGGRFLPFAFWAAHVAGALGLYSLVRHRGGRRWRLRAAAVATAVLVFGSVAVTRHLPRVAADIAFTGADAGRDADAWRSALDAMATLPPGPLLVVQRAARDPAGPSLLDGQAANAVHVTGRPTIAGLYAESAPIFEFVRLARWNLGAAVHGEAERPPDVMLGLAQARLLGVRYLLVAAPAEGQAIPTGGGVRIVDRHERWVLLELEGATAVTAVDGLTAVSSDELGRARSRWVEAGGHGAVPVEAPGPRVIPGDPGRPGLAESPRLIAGRDSMVVAGLTPGRPYLVRRSFFPNWTMADGGEGPYRAGASQMLVVPADTTVVLRWVTRWPERLGYLATAIGLVALLAVFAIGRRAGSRVAVRRSVTRRGSACSAAGHLEPVGNRADAPFSA